MSASNNYPIDIVERTDSLLKGNHSLGTQFEVTFLLNCLLGIIVAANEFDKRKGNGKLKSLPFPENLLNLIPSNLTFIDRQKIIKSVSIDRDNISWLVFNKNELCNSAQKYNLGWFLEKIRNSIAHQHIEAVNLDNAWVGIKMWNEPVIGVRDFEVEFSVSELRELALIIASIYLEAYKPTSRN